MNEKETLQAILEELRKISKATAEILINIQVVPSGVTKCDDNTDHASK